MSWICSTIQAILALVGGNSVSFFLQRSGHCDRPNCKYSHSVDHLLDEEEEENKGNKKKKGNKQRPTNQKGPNRKRPRSSQETMADSTPNDEVTEPQSKRTKLVEEGENGSTQESENNNNTAAPNSNFSTDSHGAGFDAFATAFILSVIRLRSDFDENKWRGKLYLMGKDMPLLIVKSSFH